MTEGWPPNVQIMVIATTLTCLHIEAQFQDFYFSAPMILSITVSLNEAIVQHAPEYFVWNTIILKSKKDFIT